MPENHRTTYKYLLILYFIMKLDKVEQNNKYCINGERVNLQEFQKVQRRIQRGRRGLEPRSDFKSLIF